MISLAVVRIEMGLVLHKLLSKIALLSYGLKSFGAFAVLGFSNYGKLIKAVDSSKPKSTSTTSLAKRRTSLATTAKLNFLGIFGAATQRNIFLSTGVF